MSNPYTLVFGQRPLEIIERTAQAERIISEFTQERPANYLNLITGIRGSGKTVFITQIASRLKEKDEWEVINLNPQRDMLTSLVAKLDSNRTLSRIFRASEIDLTAFGIGVDIRGADPVYDVEEALVRMLSSVRKHNKRVLITIDEATNSKEMKIFASAYQILLREDLPVFLLMTGLFKNIDGLRNAEGMTFLERAPRTVLSPLSIDAITKSYYETLKTDLAKAIRLATLTKGYSFAFQTIGYFAWENPEDDEKAMRDAREYLYEFAYRKIWSELSPKDREMVRAIADAPNGEVKEIRALLGYSSNQFNPYRDRLIKAGVVLSPSNGHLEFALPWFEEFAKNVYQKEI